MYRNVGMFRSTTNLWSFRHINIYLCCSQGINSSEMCRCHWVSSSWHVKGSCCLHVQGVFLFNNNRVFHHQVAPILHPPYRCALFDLRFSHWFCWGFRCSGMWCFVIPNILKIVGPPSWTFENEVTMIHEMSWTAYVNDVVSHSYRLESSATLLPEHQALHSVTFVYM